MRLVYKQTDFPNLEVQTGETRINNDYPKGKVEKLSLCLN